MQPEASNEGFESADPLSDIVSRAIDRLPSPYLTITSDGIFSSPKILRILPSLCWYILSAPKGIFVFITDHASTKPQDKDKEDLSAHGNRRSVTFDR